jgi:hypothetical protein
MLFLWLARLNYFYFLCVFVFFLHGRHFGSWQSEEPICFASVFPLVISDLADRNILQNMLKFFSSSLRPDEFVTKLKSFVDEEEIDPGSPTQFIGDRPVIGRFDTRQFTLHRRIGTNWILWWLTPGQWFKPYLKGNVTTDHSGSRIEITGGTPILIKILWVLVLLGGAGSIALWTMLSYPYNLAHDPAHSASNFLGGIILLNLAAGILVVLPIIGWLQTRLHLSDIVSELQRHLDLRPVE